MSKPPAATPSSDIDGVNEDARVGTPSKKPEPDAAQQIEHAQDESKGRPEQKEG